MECARNFWKSRLRTCIANVLILILMECARNKPVFGGFRLCTLSGRLLRIPLGEPFPGFLEQIFRKCPCFFKANDRVSQPKQTPCGWFTDRYDFRKLRKCLAAIPVNPTLAKKGLRKRPFYRVQKYAFFANVASFLPKKIICEE